jgi:ribonucleoside-diphosphate reductase alpha chain
MSELVADVDRALLEQQKWKPRLTRRHLPNERASVTHKFTVAGFDGYITVGGFDDGAVGEVFLTISKEGSVIRGWAGAFATMVSMALQYGVPLKAICEKFCGVRFEPMGRTENDQIPNVQSIVDYVAEWLALRFLQPEDWPEIVKANQSRKG